MSSSLYFAYGSNLLSARIVERLGPCQPRGPGWLDGFTLRFHKRGRDGSGKGDAFRTAVAEDRLYGALFEVTGTQTQRLDTIEGSGYRRELLTLQTDTGSVDAWIYIAKRTQIEPSLIPFDWYRQLVEHGAREAGLPDQYIRRIAMVAAQRDPDLERSRTHFSMIEVALGRPPAR